MKGEELRGKVEDIYTLMNEINVFLTGQGRLTDEADKLISQIQENSNELFYLIPLQENDNGE